MSPILPLVVLLATISTLALAPKETVVKKVTPLREVSVAVSKPQARVKAVKTILDAESIIKASINIAMELRRPNGRWRFLLP